MDMVYLWVHSYSFNTYLLSTCCLPGTVVDSEVGMNRTEMAPAFKIFTSWLGRQVINKQTKKHMI